MKTEKVEENGKKQPADFIDETELCGRLKISRGTAVNHRKSGLLPFVKLGHGIRYFWPSVQEALLRKQRGGSQ